MILAFDTYYVDGKARTICLAFERWTDTEPTATYSETLDEVEEYTPGAFYKRELPCILSLLNTMGPMNMEAIIIDGFVTLNDEGDLGLGGHLHAKLGGSIPVIGVAKTNFATTGKNKRELMRGGSKRPLYITALGIDLDKATECIRTMHGNFRIPTLLKQLDGLTKS